MFYISFRGDWGLAMSCFGSIGAKFGYFVFSQFSLVPLASVVNIVLLYRDAMLCFLKKLHRQSTRTVLDY